MIRAFVALELPGAVRGALPEPPGAGWRPVPEESLHVTLVFLGGVEPADATGMRAALAGALTAQAPLSLGDAVMLPAGRPRVLAVEVRDPSGSCFALQAAIAGALGVVESRRWRPHVTIARALGRVNRRARLPAVAPLEFTPEFVTLYRSHPGSRYEALARLPLPGG